MPTLGVNIDHVATLRQARKTYEPDPVWAAAAAQLGGADQITVHLREDRRHIQDRDLQLLRETVSVRLNLECACVESMLEIACQTRPHQVCLVPEKREEVTTEGGLDVVGNQAKVADAIKRLRQAGIEISLFIDPHPQQVEVASHLQADAIELHTGCFADAFHQGRCQVELGKLQQASRQASQLGLRVDAGHGLNYVNVLPVASIPEVAELNIGHSIVSRSVFVGLQTAVQEMKALFVQSDARGGSV